MTVSVLIPWRSDGGRRDELMRYVGAWWRWAFPDFEICLGIDVEEPFNRSRARNDAFARSSGDLLIVADADTVPTRAGVTAALSIVEDSRHWQWVIAYEQGRYYNLSEAATNRVLASSPATDIPEPMDEADWEHKLTSWAGCLVMGRSAWETVGGYSERFVGWGYEDNAFRLALDTLVGDHARVSSYVCHLWHPITPGTNFDQPRINDNRALCQQFERARGRREEMRKVIQ